MTASINTSNTTSAAGTFAAGTVLTFTSANSAVTVAGTSLTDTAASASVLGLDSTSGDQSQAGSTMATLTAGSATDTLTGVVALVPGGSGTTFYLNMDGQSLSTLFNSNNGTAISALTASSINVSLNSAGTVATVTQAASQVLYAWMADATASEVQDSAATTGAPVVVQKASPIGGGTFGTISVTNANDALTGGSITISGNTLNLGTVGQTDNLADLAVSIDSSSLHSVNGITASLNSAGTQIVLSGGTQSYDKVYGTGVTTTLSLTGTPTTSGQSNATTMGSITLPFGDNPASTLGGTLTLGTESITLGTPSSSTTAGTQTMAELAQTINTGNYGVKAALSNGGVTMTFTSTDANNDLVTPTISAGGTNFFVFSNSQGVTDSQYYSVGISGTVKDTSTGGGTATTGLSFNRNGSGGTATISYSDTTGTSLSNTDLSTQTSAQATLTTLNKAISDVAAQDGYIGAQINTLNSVSSVLSTQEENVTSAQNAVQATDYASATSNMSKYQILSQTGISALAQANSMQQETKLLQ